MNHRIEQRVYQGRTNYLLLAVGIFLGLVAVLQASLVMAAEPTRPKVGLALSGGGARGAAHIGVLRVLEELNIPIDYIAGTSMGSIVGGLYVSGMTPDEIEAAMLAIDWDHVFQDDPLREDRPFRNKQDDRNYLVGAKPGFNDGKITLPTGLVQGQKFNLILRQLTLPVRDVQDFDQLSIPFRAVATEITTGDEVVLASGDLAAAMRASMSVPGAFAPVKIDGRLLVDGGISNNMPIDRVREMGADIVIAVNISTPMRPPEEVNNVLKISGQLISILTNRNSQKQLSALTQHDVLITPQLGDITSAEFNRAAEAIPIGAAAAEAARESLQTLSLSAAEYQQHVAARTSRITVSPIIQFVRLGNHLNIDERMILERVHIPLWKPLDVQKLNADLNRIYSLDLFEGVYYDVVEKDGRSGVVIHAHERSWGPNYLQFGLSLSGDAKGSSQYNLGIMYQRTAINRLGGDFRTGLQLGEEPALFAELHQPLDYRSRYFFEPMIGIKKENINVFSGRDKIAEYRLSYATLSLAAGVEIGGWGELRLGLSRSTGDADVLIGDPGLASFDVDDGDIFVRLSMDELDNVNFPHKGVYARMEERWNSTGLGADDDYNQTNFDFVSAHSWQGNTLLAGVSLGMTHAGTAGVQDRYRIGGFTRLSGLQNDELSGQQFAIAKLIYYRRFGALRLLPLYLGGSLEIGNTWEETDQMGWNDVITSGSIFFGLDSPIGPVYMGGGMAENGRRSMFMSVGKNF